MIGISSQPKRSAFTLIELLASISIIAVLSAVVFSAVGNAQKSAQATSCLTRLRVIGNAVNLFVTDNNQALPANGKETGRYYVLIGPYLSVANEKADSLRDLKVFHCPTLDQKPDIKTTSVYNFTYNTLIGFNDGNGNIDNDSPVQIPMSRIARPNFTPLIWDCAGDTGSGPNRFLPTAKATHFGYRGATSAAGLSPNHGPDCAILFVSGRVAQVNLSSLNNFPWNGTLPPTSGKDTVFDPFYAGN